MKKYNKLTPEGTKDVLFEECLVYKHIEKTLSDVFSLHCFNEVVTPGLEYYDVFNSDCFGINQEVMYKMTDNHGRLMVMRPDSTMPIARLAATRLKGLTKPIRLYYTQPIYRNNPSLKGRSDETIQTGIELLGAKGIKADLEVLIIAIEAIGKCVPNFRFEIGHAGFFRALTEQLSIPNGLREDIRCAIELKNYTLLNSLLQNLGDSKEVAALKNLPKLFGGEEVFARAAHFFKDEKTASMLDYLHKLYNLLIKLGLKDKIIVDLGLVQRNDYYTNIVFSAYAEECGDAILLGGRYDNLLQSFDMPMPAIGFAINVDAIARIFMDKSQNYSIKSADVLVHGEKGFEIKALNYSSDFINHGFKCEMSVFEKQEQAVDYAKIRGIKRVIVVGNNIKKINIE